MAYKIAIIGATGAVGHKLLTTILDRKFPTNQIYLLASTKSAGKKITHKQADEDDKYGYDITFLFTLNKKYVLDGNFKFNKARLINHSCNPNCEVLEENKPVLWITAMRDIKKNEELSYDYGFSFDSNYKDHVCKCRSKNCVGYIVRAGSRWRIPNISK